MKKGDILYKAWVSIGWVRKEKSEVEFEEWHVTHVDSRGVFLTEKRPSTWGKLSRKHGDYGWLPNPPDDCRDKIPAGSNYKEKGYHKSKSAAYRSCLPEVKQRIKEFQSIQRKIERQIAKQR